MTRALRQLGWLIRRRHKGQELEDEIRFHLEAEAEAREAAGQPRDEARAAARRDFGSVAFHKEDTRAAWGWTLVEQLVQDAGYALRMMRANRTFTTVTVVTLALGIGANTAIFSLIDTLMLRRLPVRDPHQLVEFLWQYPGDPRMNAFRPKDYERYRDDSSVFSDMLAVSSFRLEARADRSRDVPLDGEYVSGNYFAALGIPPAAGRLIEPRDDRAAAAPVAVVSWSYWKARFNLGPGVFDRQIVVNGVPVTVVGVTPAGFAGLQIVPTPDIWVPAAAYRGSAPLGFRLMGRLKAGVSIEQARAQMRLLDRARVEEIAAAGTDPQWRQVDLEVEPAGAGFSTPFHEQFARPLLVIMAVVAALLLMACTNIAGLLLARASAREREMAVRVSLGAGRLRLVRQVLTEAVLLSVIGGAIGVFLAYFGADALVRIILSGRPPVGLPQPLEIDVAPDMRVMLFTAGVAVSAGLLFGLAPAWNAFTSTPASSLRAAGSAAETKGRRLFGKALVAGQVALSVMLLSAASLFVAHLSNLRNRDIGFDRTSVLLVTLDPSGSGHDRAQLLRRYQELLARFEAIPGVRSATLSGMTPISGAAGSRFATVEGFQEGPERRRRLLMNIVAPNYFETFGTPLVAGRDFRNEDEGGPRLAIVNQAMSRYYFGDGSPLGKHVTFEGSTQPYEIVGLVGDAKYDTLRDAPPRTIYLHAFQDGRNVYSQFALRTALSPASVASEVRRAVADVAAPVRVAKMTTLAEQVDASIVPERLTATLSGLFGALGALLAAIGLYGLLGYTVARRRTEIGIRMALGATRRDVTGMVVKSAMALVAAGLLIGVPLAFWVRPAAASVVENLPADGVRPIVLAAAGMLAVAVFAAWLPARRAARVEPMDALRLDR